MTLQERLRKLVEYSPPGTLVPVESIAGLLEDTALANARERKALSLDEVAERAKDEVFGGRLTPGTGAIRQWIRSGKDGVILQAYGRPYVVTEEAWDRFVAELRKKGQERPAESSGPPAPVVASDDPQDEIDAFQKHLGRRRTRRGDA